MRSALIMNPSCTKGRCERCAGLLVVEWFEDTWVGDSEQGTRCVNCGARSRSVEGQELCELAAAR